MLTLIWKWALKFLPMSSNNTSTQQVDLIKARLRLAQELLEESDRLPGHSGYDLNNIKLGKPLYHPRHEREALVIYLLLTCFDLYGQEKGHITHQNWLNSHQADHENERQTVLDALPAEATHLEAARALAAEYQRIYGARVAFYRGIEKLPEDAKQQLFSSIHVQRSPDYPPNVSGPAFPLEDDSLEKKLQLEYLYEKRNKFTHRLHQHHHSSEPLISNFRFPNGSSWFVMVMNGKLSYMSKNQERKPIGTGGYYVFDVGAWPFVLFGVLYAAIGIQFDRTSIKLKFQVQIFHDGENKIVRTLDGVDHCHLKDYKAIVQ